MVIHLLILSVYLDFESRLWKQTQEERRTYKRTTTQEELIQVESQQEVIQEQPHETSTEANINDILLLPQF